VLCFGKAVVFDTLVFKASKIKLNGFVYGLLCQFATLMQAFATAKSGLIYEDTYRSALVKN